MREYEHEYTFTRFEEMAEKYSGNTALVYLGERFSYGALSRLIDKFATGLAELGVGKGDKVLVYIPNCPQWIIANFAINKIGAAVVPVSPIYTAFEVDYMIRDAGVKTIICLDTNFGYVKEVMDQTGLEHVIVTNLVDLVPPWKRFIGTIFDKIPKGKVEMGPKIVTFRHVLKQSWPRPPQVEMDSYEDLAYVMYTGGTTGFPKGVPGNHAGEVSYIMDIMHDIVDGRIEEGKDAVLMVNPLFHIMAKGFTIAFGFNFGNPVILLSLIHI